MANRGYGYQYETSPRKLEPEFKKQKVQKKPVQKQPSQTNSKIKKTKHKTKKKFRLSFEAKFFINSMLFFCIVFAIIACQALVQQRYKEKESLKQEYNKLLASSNMTADLSEDIRVLASEYGMQTKSATLIDLGTSDYIESSESDLETEEDGFFSKILVWIKGIFNF